MIGVLRAQFCGISRVTSSSPLQCVGIFSVRFVKEGFAWGRDFTAAECNSYADKADLVALKSA